MTGIVHHIDADRSEVDRQAWRLLRHGQLVSSLFLLGLIIVASGTMMAIAQRVDGLRDQRDQLTAEIEHERKALHMLQAEWAHLNQPARLRTLALEMTELRPLTPEQLVDWSGWQTEQEELALAPTAPHCAGLPPPPRKPTVDGNGILLATYGMGGDPI
ncbi:MAG: hypothetical protein AAF556_02285, partial [Pseudomonadota bacterium]